MLLAATAIASATLLQNQGVDFAQSFYVGRPRPGAELQAGEAPPPAAGDLRRSHI